MDGRTCITNVQKRLIMNEILISIVLIIFIAVYVYCGMVTVKWTKHRFPRTKTYVLILYFLLWPGVVVSALLD